MLFTRKWRPLTLTSAGSALLVPTSGRAGRCRNAVRTGRPRPAPPFSARARAAMAGYSSFCRARAFSPCCRYERRAGRCGVKPCRRRHLPAPSLGHHHPAHYPDQLSDQGTCPQRSAGQQLFGRVVGHRLERHGPFLAADQLVRAGAPHACHRRRLPPALPAGTPPTAHRPLGDPGHLGRLPIRTYTPGLQHGHHPQPQPAGEYIPYMPQGLNPSWNGLSDLGASTALG